MKVLIIGSGGREHAIGYKINQSSKASKIYFAPGNGGTGELGENVAIEVSQLDELRDFAAENQIDLTIVGPELPLSLGIVDCFREAGLKIFGPDKKGAQLEASKAFSKAFMVKHRIPTAKYQSFEDYQSAIDYLQQIEFPIVIKADGLAAGKGVIICEDLVQGEATLKSIIKEKVFGEQSVVIEEFLEGKEVSLLCFTDSQTIVPMESASDYKRALDGDQGLNTGGMGSISPSPYYKAGIADEIVEKTLEGIKAEGFDFRGIIYIGLMLTKAGAKVLEYNVRFGDPETEAVLLRLESDLLETLEKVADQSLDETELTWNAQPAVTVIMAAEGYPEKPETGMKIAITKTENAKIFHCGTKLEEGELISVGGRVLAVSALGESMTEARSQCYDCIEKIDFPKSFYRKDIGVF